MTMLLIFQSNYMSFCSNIRSNYSVVGWFDVLRLCRMRGGGDLCYPPRTGHELHNAGEARVLSCKSLRTIGEKRTQPHSKAKREAPLAYRSRCVILHPPSSSDNCLSDLPFMKSDCYPLLT